MGCQPLPCQLVKPVWYMPCLLVNAGQAQGSCTGQCTSRVPAEHQQSALRAGLLVPTLQGLTSICTAAGTEAKAGMRAGQWQPRSGRASAC